jgi:hypothetical protein
MFYWIFCADLYGRLNWKYVGRSGLNYNIKIRSKYVVFEKKEDELKLEKWSY